MPRVTRVGLKLILTLFGSAIFIQAPAAPTTAEPCHQVEQVDPTSGAVITVWVGDCGEPDDPDPTEPEGNGSGPQGCELDGVAIPCVTEYGVWFPSQLCYAYVIDPQPPANDPVWQAHQPSEGSIWGCSDSGPYVGSFVMFFVPDGATPGLVNPGVLARQAMGSLRLELATAHIAPPPSFHTYINYRNWMWVPDNQWHTLDKSVSTGPTTVTVAAVPRRVEWDMGPETVNCPGPGRAWVPGMPENAPTNCSYTYVAMEDPYGDTWRVSAQIVYDVDWTCTGACLASAGTLGEVTAPPGETTTIEVLQRQTVVVR